MLMMTWWPRTLGYNLVAKDSRCDQVTDWWPRTAQVTRLQLGGQGHDREGLPHAETLLSVDEQGVRLDL